MFSEYLLSLQKSSKSIYNFNFFLLRITKSSTYLQDLESTVKDPWNWQILKILHQYTKWKISIATMPSCINSLLKEIFLSCSNFFYRSKYLPLLKSVGVLWVDLLSLQNIVSKSIDFILFSALYYKVVYNYLRLGINSFKILGKGRYWKFCTSTRKTF